MSAFRLKLLGCLIALAPIAGHATEPTSGASEFHRSATKARDIGGFMLGMHIRDAAKMSPIEALGGDDFQTVRDGITYDFGVTPKGRIYRVSSSQVLGLFAIDRAFLDDLSEKLAGKYGTPINLSATTFKWSLIEPIKRINGTTLPFETNWASTMVLNGPEGVSVETKLLDFRILWRDEATVNQAPREKGSQAIVF